MTQEGFPIARCRRSEHISAPATSHSLRGLLPPPPPRSRRATIEVVGALDEEAENGRPPSLESVRALVDRLRARHAEIARAIYDRLREAVPDSVGARDLTYQAGALAAVNAVLSYSFDVIEHGPGWSVPIPPDAVSQARRAARAGVSQGAVLRRYLAGHARLGEFVAEETTRIGLARTAPALLEISRTRETLLEYLTAAIEHEYDQEHQRIAHSPEHRRAELVRRLLDGDPVARSEPAGLCYPVDTWHVGVIATGASAKDALGRLKANRQLLSVPQSDETVWAWLGGQQQLTHADIERVYSDSESGDVLLAIGEPGRGIEGWRRTHHQAQQAHRVALLAPQPLTRYADIALLMPWLEELDEARALIDLYLSPLHRLKDGGAASRRVMRAYFETARNVSAAARKLGLERRTLAYRLQAIEDCLLAPDKCWGLKRPRPGGRGRVRLIHGLPGWWAGGSVSVAPDGEGVEVVGEDRPPGPGLHSVIALQSCSA